tara:strand:+ start:924 stop:1559 length:636 start_codon:yes stop_codon:yes gene_type:complete
MAARLATYISDPSTIRVRVLETFGKAPSLAKCRELRARIATPKQERTSYYAERFRQKCDRHSGTYELDADGFERCVECLAEKHLDQQRTVDRENRIERAQKAAKRVQAVRLATLARNLSTMPKPVLFPDLLNGVAAAFKITPDDITGIDRRRLYVDARAALVRILRQRGSSFPMIGKRLNRDHSSIIYLEQTFDIRAKRNPLIALVVERLA